MTISLQRASEFDTATLRAAVDGNSDRVAPGAALNLLLAKGYPGLQPIFQEILNDTSRDVVLRTQAAALVARSNCHRSEEILLACLDDTAPRVQLEAVKSLGRVGRATAFKKVQAFAKSAKGRVKQQADYAAVLIGARAALPGDLVAVPKPKGQLKFDPTCAEPAIARATSRAEFDDVIRDLISEPLGISYEERSTLRLSGGDLDWVLLLNSERRELLCRQEANVLLGAVAEWDGSGERWHLIYVLIACRAEKDGARAIVALDVAGEAAFCGSLRVKLRQVMFDLATVSSFALPAQISGHCSDDHPVIDRFMFTRTHPGRGRAKILPETDRAQAAQFKT